MLSQQVLTLGPAEKTIILSFLRHPRLLAIRRQFQEQVSEVLGNDRETERLAQISEVPVEEFVGRTRRLLLDLESDRPRPDDEEFGRTAETALTFFASPILISLWGHFTMALQKVMMDHVTVGEIATACGAGDLEDVRSAIRQFSSSG